MCLLILFHFILLILKTSEIHNMQLSNFLSYPQGKPVATPASYLKWSWEWCAVLTVSLLCSVLVAYKLNLLWQMMVMPTCERLVLCWENRAGCMEVTCPGEGKWLQEFLCSQCVLDVHRSAKNAHQQVKKSRQSLARSLNAVLRMVSVSLPSNREECCRTLSLCSIFLEMQDEEGSLAAKSPCGWFHIYLQPCCGVKRAHAPDLPACVSCS